MRFLTLSLFLAAGLLAPGGAMADCVSDCQASTYCGGSSYDCAQMQSECYRRECQGGEFSADLRPQGAFGAIAFDKSNGAYGMSDVSADKKSAVKSALGYCSRYGDQCRVVETFANLCAAIAEGSDGTVAWAKHDNRQAAGERAVKRCNKKFGENCLIALLNCYGR